ncbi:2OG-Fe(II) oxygenase [Pontibacterium sp. N1Y112]|uniref:2OG-Fe(II) oxygenase n=1 Tax=Pontibacterium sinense TaxID=2781979 RepID=A0A8J7FH78_9GAMM|nr:2OG-Fe(II) oxygenase [Pontibacterium sinense]MBE9399714.1 2OG-Fe(II) oxygenase [Pontibacterium sinense]
MSNDNFYIVAREPGAEHPALPTWANTQPNPALLDETHDREISRRDIPEVPGAFQILNVLSQEECQRLISITESLGYMEDAAVSLPRNVRHNDNVTWVVDELTDGTFWQRTCDFMGDPNNIFDGKKPLGINARFRFYRYGVGDYFKPHIDGDWPGSRVIDNTLVPDAYPDRWSKMTFLVLLSEDFEGGSTQFWVNKDDPSKPGYTEKDSLKVDIRTPAGSVLCFPHGRHPMHCLHSSEEILKGTKYIIRTDVLFEA